MAMNLTKAEEEKAYARARAQADHEQKTWTQIQAQHTAGYTRPPPSSNLLTGSLIGNLTNNAADIGRHLSDSSMSLDSLRAENAQLRRALDKVQRQSDELKARFASTFGIPVECVSRPDTTRAPDHPMQWRVRVHVEAFTVECTLGELTAARVDPDTAIAWSERWEAHARLERDNHIDVIANAKREIFLRVLHADNKIESAEKPFTSDPPKD